MRVFPSYLQTGKNFLIEKAKQRWSPTTSGALSSGWKRSKPMPTVETVLEQLTALADPGKLRKAWHICLVG
jgi:hypothetical protein